MAKDYLNVRLESEDFDSSEVEIAKLEGLERISQLFEFHLEVVFKSPDGPGIDRLVGAEVALVFERADKEVRRVYGMINQAENRYNTEDDYACFGLEVVPRMWRMTLVETLEIYIDLSVVDIIRSKLELVDLGVEGTDFEFRLMESYPAREFVVQYKETDLAFVSRLAEHVGMSFFFEHAGGKDKIVFSDNSGGTRPIEGEETVPFHRRGEQVGVFELKVRQRLIPATYVCRDYNYRTPQLELQSEHALEEGFAGAVIEYGSHFKTPDEGDFYARIRAEERLCRRTLYRGESVVQTFSSGASWELTGHPSLSPRLLLVEVQHHATQPVLGRGTDEERSYHNEFTAIESSLTYRPPRSTAVPKIDGVITGVIETGDGSIGKYAKIDEQGRYTVKFLFDTAPPGERRASHPVRRLQPTAGPNYGMHFPLRPGIEVLLAFVDGDPDRPLIVGAVPNPVTPTPVDQGVSTKNRLKTESGVIFEIEDGVGS